jgi:murein DD-endopeptidase MepM/ murein hydrolase activator NlpD
MKKRSGWRRSNGRYAAVFSLFLSLALPSLACLISGAGETNRLSDTAYWACQTATPVPTEQFIAGWTTPPPVGTGTPAPTSEPIYGYTTPVPTETPYYRVGSFYQDQKVYVNGIEFNLTGHNTAVAPDPAQRYHYFHFSVANHHQEGDVVPLSQLLFVRTVTAPSGAVLTGRWANSNGALLAGAYPLLEEVEQTPLTLWEARHYTIGMLLPAGQVTAVGLGTDWERPLEGGVPVWFHLAPDPTFCPYGSAVTPPPPTPRVLGDSYGGGGQSGGSAVWPATGSITSPFGCRPTITGIISSNCPPGYEFHNGIDIANSAGTTVLAPVSGIVTHAGAATSGPDCSTLPGSNPPHLGYGLYVRIAGGNGQTHILAHLQSTGVEVGQSVSAGQPIGAMNSTGCSTGSHLHWSCYVNGSPVDPAGC